MVIQNEQDLAMAKKLLVILEERIIDRQDVEEAAGSLKKAQDKKAEVEAAIAAYLG